MEAEPVQHAAFTVLAEHISVRPGDELLLGLKFTIDEHWHLYWDGLNDSGTAPSWEIELPEGWSTGPALWPAPKRLISPGDILDHVYEGTAMILVPVRVPRKARMGIETIRVRCTWLACREACVFEKGEATTRVRVGARDEFASGDVAESFERARERIPEAIDKSTREIVGWRLVDDNLVIEAPGAKTIRFFPRDTGAAYPDLIAKGEVQGERLVLRVLRKERETRVAGVVELVTQHGAKVVRLDVHQNDLRGEVPRTIPMPTGGSEGTK